MSGQFDEVKKHARSLTDREKADLARQLIVDLDSSVDSNSEALWIEEATRRYEAFQNGELEVIPGDEVMKRVRQRLP